MDCKTLKGRFETAKSNRSNIEGTFELIEKFVVPYRGKFFDTNQTELSIDWRKRDLYDSTAVMANQILASNLHSGLTNPQIQWFELMFREETLNKDQESRAWLDKVARRIFQALQESNFNLEANEAYLDITSYGTAVVVEEVVKKGLEFDKFNFSAVPIVQCFFEQAYDGSVQYFYRLLSWTAVQIVTKFGKKNVPKEIRDEAERNDGVHTKHEVVYAIYPNKGNEDADTRTILPSNQRPFGWKYFLVKGAQRLGEAGGYYEMPAFIPRWRSNVDSMWGYSPSMVVLSDILSLNQLVELILKSAEKVVDPPILTTRRGVFGDIDLDSAGVTVVQNLDAVKPFVSGARFDVSQLQKTELQKSVREAYFIDQLELKQSPVMTATEVNARMEIMQRLMGPTLSRLQSDFLDPLIERTFLVLMRLGQLPKPPEAVIKSRAELDISYMGPMARAQKSQEAAAVERFMGSVTAMSDRYPAAADIPNIDEVVGILAESGNVPPRALNNTAKIKAIREQRAQDMDTQKKIAMASEGGKAMQEMGVGMETVKEVMPDAIGGAG